MNKKLTLFLAVIALLTATLACQAIMPSTGSTSIANARVAFDQNGESPTSVFSPSDDFYVVFDLNNGQVGDSMDAKWYGEDTADGDGPTYLFYEQNYTLDQKVLSTQLVYFQIYNEKNDWPVGLYKVELYLNGTLAQTVEFEVR